MAREADHISLANRNHAILMHLMKDAGVYGDWIATIGFYKAVHVVEAVYANNLRLHSTSHNDREQRLKLPIFSAISRDYSHLVTASRIARYLEDGRGTGFQSFDDYMHEDDLRKLIRKRLFGVEQKSLPFLSDVEGKRLLKIDTTRI